MYGRFDYDDEDVVVMPSTVNEPAGESMDAETVEILEEDRIATGG